MAFSVLFFFILSVVRFLSQYVYTASGREREFSLKIHHPIFLGGSPFGETE